MCSSLGGVLRMRKSRAEPKVCGLTAGAKGIRTPGPIVNGADTQGRPTPTIAPSLESAAYRSGISLRQHVGPGVRIHFAPAESLQTFGPSAQRLSLGDTLAGVNAMAS